MLSKYFPRILAILIVSSLFFSACMPQAAPSAFPTSQIVADTPAVAPAIKVVVSTAVLSGEFIGEAVPVSLRKLVENLEIPAHSDFRLDVSQSGSSSGIQFQWIYALVAPFPTVTDGVTSDELRSAWSGGTPPAPFNRMPLLMEESTLKAFTAIWGEPAPGSVRSVPVEQLSAMAWDESAWAIIPFESLEPNWKVLAVDGQSPIRKNFDPSKYPLVVHFILQSSSDLQPSNLPTTNYDPSKLTTIIMTGVTALVRATAVTMEIKGATYPGEKIRDLMRAADIAHVSNEIPFFTGCPYPKPDASGPLVFCSDPKYMDLLTDVGTDVVELTGNHFADYGPQAMYETLDMYIANKLPYFGGGRDLQDSLEPALFEVNGNKIAFIGCNRPDVGRFPTATDYQPGAAPCDFEYLTQKINQLKAEGYVVISTFQWYESYDPYPNPAQITDFRLMAESGASIVSGSQAHYAQAMEFYGNSFIHYGLGNLFFDQMGDQDWMPPGIRREFLDRYVIYDGHLISVELITAMLEDYSRPRIMRENERAGFLQEYFYYSGWMPLIPTPTPTITLTLTPMSLPPLSGPSSLLPSNTPTLRP